MTDKDKLLLAEFESGVITEAVFLKDFSVDINNDEAFVRTAMLHAIATEDIDEIETTLNLVWLSDDTPQYVDILNGLLINPHHNQHQRIAKYLQDCAPDPATIPFVRKALESNFDYLEYTCSGSGTIAKWFSWLLSAIGTKEAIDLMEEYTHSEDEGISNEMRYRLQGMKGEEEGFEE